MTSIKKAIALRAAQKKMQRIIKDGCYVTIENELDQLYSQLNVDNVEPTIAEVDKLCRDNPYMTFHTFIIISIAIIGIVLALEPYHELIGKFIIAMFLIVAVSPFFIGGIIIVGPIYGLSQLCVTIENYTHLNSNTLGFIIIISAIIFYISITISNRENRHMKQDANVNDSILIV